MWFGKTCSMKGQQNTEMQFFYILTSIMFGLSIDELRNKI